jgi:hypothetical protein
MHVRLVADIEQRSAPIDRWPSLTMDLVKKANGQGLKV